MKKIFFILTFCLYIFPNRAYGFDYCSNISVHPEVNVYTSYGKLTYDFSLNQMGITEIAMQKGHIESGVFANGLAVGTIEWEINVSAASTTGYNNQICATPKVVNFYIGFKNPKIYISNDLKKGSCMYDLVLRHEQTHQQINIKLLEYFVPLFQQALNKISKEVPAVAIRKNSQAALSEGSKKITKLYSERITPLVNIFKKEMAIEQGNLDNSSNYAFENSLCR